MPIFKSSANNNCCHYGYCSVLLMCIEPEGMTFEVTVVGTSHARSTKSVIPKGVSNRGHESVVKSNSAPLPQMVSSSKE